MVSIALLTQCQQKTFFQEVQEGDKDTREGHGVAMTSPCNTFSKTFSKAFVAVPGRHQTLFRCVFRSYYCFQISTSVVGGAHMHWVNS